MIYHDIDQRSDEWKQLRVGIPTSSAFDRIITAGGKSSEQAAQYMYWLLAEWMVGHQLSDFVGRYMEQGTELEAAAIAKYEFINGLDTFPGGFFTTDNGMIGSSPDRLIGGSGLLEAKSPKHNTHIGYLLTGQLTKDYKVQLQGQLWVCEREWTDMVSYHPEMPTKIIRVTRDEGYIATMAGLVNKFVEKMLGYRDKLEAEFGPFRQPEPEPGFDGMGISTDDVEAHIAALKESGALPSYDAMSRMESLAMAHPETEEK